jgi:hypothetical protein
MKPRQVQMIVLAVLLVLFAVIVYRSVFPSAPAAGSVSAADESFVPLNVENPALRLDLLDQLKKLEYQGTHRNIFSSVAPPPEITPAQKAALAAAAAKPPEPTGPPPVPPLTVPATFFGYVTDGSGARRAFFSEGDDVYVVGVGEVLLGRFRLLQIGNSTAELEETASGRHATLTLEEPPPSS